MSIRRVDADLRWSSRVRKGIDIQRHSLRILRKLRAVPTVALTDSMWTRRIASIQTHRIDLLVDDRVFVRIEVDPPRRFIDRQEFIDLPCASRQRVAKLSVQTNQIQLVG